MQSEQRQATDLRGKVALFWHALLLLSASVQFTSVLAWSRKLLLIP